MDNQRVGVVRQIQTYLWPFGVYYPGIDAWFERVWLEAQTDRRRVWVVTSGGEVSGLAITKTGAQAKLCHISLSPSLRKLGVGFVLVRTAVEDLLKKGAITVHLTASDDITEEHGAFFDRCGFQIAGWARNRYRLGSDEFVWTANRESLKSRLVIGPELERRQLFAYGVDSPFLNKSGFTPATEAATGWVYEGRLLERLRTTLSTWTLGRLRTGRFGQDKCSIILTSLRRSSHAEMDLFPIYSRVAGVSYGFRAGTRGFDSTDSNGFLTEELGRLEILPTSSECSHSNHDVVMWRIGRDALQVVNAFNVDPCSPPIVLEGARWGAIR